MGLHYSHSGGVTVKDAKSGIQFQLTGPIDTHPIDIALDKLTYIYYSTVEIKECQVLAIDAWKNEVEREYRIATGAGNQLLKASQETWEKYQNSHIKYLNSIYSGRDGTIWGITSLGHRIRLFKARANELKSINSWGT